VNNLLHIVIATGVEGGGAGRTVSPPIILSFQNMIKRIISNMIKFLRIEIDIVIFQKLVCVNLALFWH